MESIRFLANLRESELHLMAMHHNYVMPLNVKKLLLVERRSSARHRDGETILASGIYSAFHAEHRVPDEVTLLAHEKFPVCSRCDAAVWFQLIRAASVELNNMEFPIKLYALPVLDDATGGLAAKAG